MRNLSLFRNFATKHSALTIFCDSIIFNDSATWKTTHLCVASSDGIIYILDTDCDTALNISSIIDLKKLECIRWLDTTLVVKLQQVFTTLYIILNSGIFVIVPSPYCCIEELKAFDSEIRHVSQVVWSRDSERTVVVDNSSIISVLCIVNDECEKLIDFSLEDVEEEENKFVDLGWGSVETQFRGGVEIPKPNKEKVNTCVDASNNEIQIVWKDDSSVFAVSYVCRREKNRKMKIFNRNGVLLNITKDLHGLQLAMDWCPSKNLIFVIQTLYNKTVACCLEENGLRHGEFRLPNNFKVDTLVWNKEGTILATLGKLQNADDHTVFLWTTSNYKWYIKYNLTFEKRVLYLQWDDVLPNRLHLVLSTGIYRMFEWFFDTTESVEYTINDQNSKLVVLVDGATAWFTNYGSLFPPISIPEHDYSFPTCVNAFVFAGGLRSAVDTTASGRSVNAELFLALVHLSDNSIILYDTLSRISESVGRDSDEKLFRFVLRQKNKNSKSVRFDTAAEITAWLWLPERKRLYFCWTRLDGYYFCESSFCFASQRCVIRRMIKVTSRVLIMKSYKYEIIVHLENGAILIFKDDKLCSSQLILPEPCFCIEVLNSTTMVALSENRNLYVNEQIKWRNIRSFRWRRPFLMAVTSNHRLAIAKVKRNKFDDILSRRIEPKSRIITIVGDRIVLQADRGNIELITPRPFVVFEMALKLRDGRYFDVFKLLRKQRVNLNVLFDHHPNAFLKDVGFMCDTILEPSYLTLFVMELENSNVARRMFPWKYQKNKSTDCATENKVHSVCEALRVALMETEWPKLVLPTIAVLVRLGKLAEASKLACENGEIYFLFQLTDNRSVYEATLASYDLTNALKVAEFSKMDPSDYIPFVEKLQKMPNELRKFTINDYLGKTKEALKCLSVCEEDLYFEECLKYIEKHQLYSEAFEIFTENLKLSLDGNDQTARTMNIRYVKIASTFAQHLFRKKFFEEAAVAFEKARMYDKALECYISTGNWHATVSLVQSMHLNESLITELYNKLHSSLVLKQRHEDAGFVAFVLLKNSSLAAGDYLLARRYTKAIESAKSFGSFPMILPSLKFKLLEEAEMYVKELHSDTNLLKQYVERLKRIDDAEKTQQNNSEESDQCSHSDSYTSSESATTSSLSLSQRSSSSGATSAKRIRRRERKLWNLKPGNPREQPSLVNAIRELVCDGEKKLLAAIPELIDALVLSEEYDAARQLRTDYSSYLQFIQRVVSNLWDAAKLKEEGGFKDLLIKCPPTWTTFNDRNKFINILSL